MLWLLSFSFSISILVVSEVKQMMYSMRHLKSTNFN